MPQLYTAMLQFFHELKFSYVTDLGYDLVLFNNKDILIDNKTFSTKCCSRKEFSEFKTSLQREVIFSHTVNLPRYSLNCNILQYLQVVSTIPKRLLKKEKQNLDPKFIFSQDNAFFQLSSTVKVNLLKLKSKDYYLSFINKVNLELKAPK